MSRRRLIPVIRRAPTDMLAHAVSRDSIAAVIAFLVSNTAAPPSERSGRARPQAA